MQYQHLVFEEFARKIQPNIDVFLVPQGYDATINPAIVAEFAHVVYRFGHSMLTESIDRFDADFTPDHIGLIEGFLNPTAFLNGGDAADAAGSIIRGMTRQAGNEIDEFVTGALRNNLLGLPLDLATINLARGRDTGVPVAQRGAARVLRGDQQQLGAAALRQLGRLRRRPQEPGLDRQLHRRLRHPHADHRADTLEGKRDAALTIITGESVGGLLVPEDAVDFLNSTGVDWGTAPGLATNTGLDNVDLWIGGLAEKNMPFGGMLGSTFNFVFEVQMEKLQNSDRFYYLQRLDGLHLFSEMEANSFAAMIMQQHRRHPPAVGRVLHPRPDPGSEPGAAVQCHRRGDDQRRPDRRHTSSIRWSTAPTTRPPAPTPTTCATPAAITSCSAAPTWAMRSTRQATTS